MSEHLKHRLRWAREISGLTQSQVGEKIGFGATSISEMESGAREPSVSQLSKLGRVYRRTLDFFLEDAPPPTREVPALWRQRPSEEAEFKQLEASFRELAEQYHALENLCDDARELKIPASDGIPKSRFDYDHAASLAQKVQRELDLGESPGEGLLGAFEERWGIKVFFVDFGRSGSAASMRSDAWGAAIFLHAGANHRRRRAFDLAHELFHLVTWRDFNHHEEACPRVDAQEESLANAFAARLLMPGESFKAMCLDCQTKQGWTHDTLLALCRRYCVSPEALLWRMKGVGLVNLTEDQVKTTAEAMRALARLIEPAEDVRPPSPRPERYEALARRALMHGALSVSAYARYMGIPRHEAAKIADQQEQEALHVEETVAAA